MNLSSSTAVPAIAAGRSGARSDPTATPAVHAARHAGLFVGITLTVTVVAAAGAFAGIVPTMLPFVLAFAPAVVAVSLAARERNGAVRRLLHSAVARPAHARWVLALLIPVLATLAVIPAAMALGQPTTGLFGKLIPDVFLVPLVVLLPAFTEEIGWRGFALPRLGSRFSPLMATLILGVPWMVLHLALFLPGQMYENLAIWPSVVAVLSLAVITSWIYIRTGSVLITALFHALFNGTTPLMWGLDSDLTWALRAIVVAVVAVAVVALGGFRGVSLRAAPR